MLTTGLNKLLYLSVLSGAVLQTFLTLRLAVSVISALTLVIYT